MKNQDLNLWLWESHSVEGLEQLYASQGELIEKQKFIKKVVFDFFSNELWNQTLEPLPLEDEDHLERCEWVGFILDKLDDIRNIILEQDHLNPGKN